MLKRMFLVAGAVVVALAATALFAGTVFADGPGPKAGYGTEIGGRAIPLAVAAELTGLTEELLLAELEGGKTIPALLDEMRIDLATFHQAVADARQAIVEAVVDPGAITPERAQGLQEPQGPMHGASYGEPGEGTGPGLSHHYGAAWQ